MCWSLCDHRVTKDVDMNANELKTNTFYLISKEIYTLPNDGAQPYIVSGKFQVGNEQSGVSK